jgi:hypothetical protein
LEQLSLQRNRMRPDRDFGPHVVRRQLQDLRRSLRGLQKEGFRHVHVLHSVDEVESVTIVREPLYSHKHAERGPFDLIGDVHGCFDELAALLIKLGYTILLATPWRSVDLTDPHSEAAATEWWLALTASGGDGMVVKPLDFVTRNAKNRLVQPALKCRGREYLRLIYGPEYTRPEHLERLRARGVGAKRALAAREFALGIEGLERFVNHEPLRRVHECAFGVLALESEPVDPRL